MKPHPHRDLVLINAAGFLRSPGVGLIKVTYDLLLYRAFRGVRPPEEVKCQRFVSLVAANPAQFYENRFAIKYTYSWRP